MNKHPKTEQLLPLQKGAERTKQISALGNAAKKRYAEERKKMKQDLSVLLKVAIKRGDVIKPEDILSLEQADKQNVSAQTAIIISMIKRAILGDVQAAQFLRDTVGEKPTDKLEVDQSLTVEEWAKNHKVKL